MCGWVVVLDAKGDVSEPALRRMADAILHRGPDDEGYWIGAQGRVGLGFRRLSILDLSPLGHQPMVSPSGRFTCVFNGEIYNFEQLRNELAALGSTFLGHSDTEVMLHAFEQWGLEKSLQRFNGMFAMAVWDASLNALTLARDRFGKKPLYIARCGSTWLMGSELKSFKAHPAFRGQMSSTALAVYLRYGYVPGPLAIFEGVEKLQPGHMRTITPGGFEGESHPFWSASDLLSVAERDPFRGTETEGMNLLDSLARDAVRLRMISDVPLGAFLSGGIDSSLVVALMQAQSRQAVKTFTIGFEEQAYNEAGYAKAVAQHLGTDHTEVCLSASDALKVIPDMARIYDEPFGDPSQIPTYLVSRLARQQVTVALSGDGGDELFGGYNRYFHGAGVHRRLRPWPRPLRKAAKAVLLSQPPERLDKLLGCVRWALPASLRSLVNGDRLHKAALLLDQDRLEDIYRVLTSLWPAPEDIVKGRPSTPGRSFGASAALLAQGPLAQMMFLDTISYLPDDILVKVDRASMACSLEVRAPLLDIRIAELAWRMPMHWKIRGNEGKSILRNLAYRYVPRPLLDRPKMGFGVPVGDWVRGPLREWAEDLMSPAQLEAAGLSVEPVRRVWTEHATGARDWQYRLWPLLMYLSWRQS